MPGRYYRPQRHKDRAEKAFLYEEKPFPHVKVAPALNAEKATKILRLLDDMVWKRVTEEYYEFNVLSVQSQKEELQQCLLNWRIEDTIHVYLETYLDTSLTQKAIIEPHQYLPGTGIGVHTDGSVEEARFVLNLNREWRSDQGGVWILSRGSDLKPPVIYLPPIHNTGFGFMTAKASYHALSERFSAVAYTLVFRFEIEKRKGGNPYTGCKL